MRGDGDGWVVSDSGIPFWGRYGAAGLLLRAPRADGTPAVLLQHRAPWSH
ncbi:MAG: DNA mismatch repair protein MutT, partial [Mycobacterium sp.]